MVVELDANSCISMAVPSMVLLEVKLLGASAEKAAVYTLVRESTFHDVLVL
jgi:hypothetical protein